MMRRLALAVVASLGLPGCQSPVISQTSYDLYFRSGVVSEFGYAAPGGEMPVAVVGNPFPIEKPRVDQAVVDAMQGHNYGPRVRFVNGPSASARPGYVVVMMLDAAPDMSADALCVDERRPAFMPRNRAERTTLLAAFCGGSDARSWAWSSGPRIDSPDDPLFAQMVAQSTFMMLPPRDDDFGTGDFQ
jgi:hypothetical protein